MIKHYRLGGVSETKMADLIGKTAVKTDVDGVTYTGEVIWNPLPGVQRLALRTENGWVPLGFEVDVLEPDPAATATSVGLRFTKNWQRGWTDPYGGRHTHRAVLECKVAGLTEVLLAYEVVDILEERDAPGVMAQRVMRGEMALSAWERYLHTGEVALITEED